MNGSAAVWIILSTIISVAALAAFALGRATALQNEQRAPWWPDKLHRLFWLCSPFLLTIVTIRLADERGLSTGPLWAFFFALLIVQAVVGGMFGFHFDLVSSIVCGVFLAVEYFFLGAIVLFGILDFGKFVAAYIALGLVGISAGAVVAAWLGTLSVRTKRRGR